MRIKKPSVKPLCQWIQTMATDLSPEVMVRGFKQCCSLFDEMDEREDEEEVETRWEL
jgi:hypothetical protein